MISTANQPLLKMNWRHYDALIIKKLKSRSRKAAKQLTKESKPELNSLLINPILVNLDEISTKKMDRKKLPRLPYTCFVCDGNFPSSDDERRHNCDAATKSPKLSQVSACDVQITVTSESAILNVSSGSGDSGVFSEDSNSSENFTPQIVSCQSEAAEPQNKILKRRSDTSEFKHLPLMKRVCVESQC